MPSAVVRTGTVRFDLKTLPDAFVELRQMSYGEAVQRRSMLKLNIAMTQKSKDVKGEMAMANQEITMMEFKLCIVDHNLEDEDGRKLNLGSVSDFNRLDPRVGGEIDKYISDMNNFDENEDDIQGN